MTDEQYKKLRLMGVFLTRREAEREERRREKICQDKERVRKIVDFVDTLKGTDLFEYIPISEQMRNLFNGLIEKGFIGRETELENFCVVLGRPRTDDGNVFQKVRWISNGQMFSWFARTLYNKRASFLTHCFFVNKYGKDMTLANIDNKRLESEKNKQLHLTLTNLLSEYKGGLFS